MELEFDYEDLDLQAIDAIEQDYLQRRDGGTEVEGCSLDDEAFEAAAIAAADEAEAMVHKNSFEDALGVVGGERRECGPASLPPNTELPRPSQEGKQKTLDCYWTCSAKSREEVQHEPGVCRKPIQSSMQKTRPVGSRGDGIFSSVFRREREKRKCRVPVDRESALTWVYPSQPPVRDYQYSMVQTSLFDNTLVCLPTGLGKTLIAAVVMYNFYRWFPGGKILFMAPTRPLVSQQIEACWKIMGISKDDAIELTGQTKSMERAELWETKRVFYLTPQVLENDLRQGICPAKKVVCMVLDEAHRAQGNYAYVASTRLLQDSGACFRLLALSATPGGSYSEIQSVITNLSIAKVEFRSEEDPDVSKYCFKRSIRVLEVRPSDHLSNAREVLLDGLLRPVVKMLVSCGVYYKTNVESIGRFSYLQAQKAFRANPPESLHQSRYAEVELRFQQALRLASVYEQLEKYGIETALQAIEDGVKGPLGRLYREEPCFRQLKAMLQGLIKGEIVHPKIERLQNILQDHFHKGNPDKVAGRVIVFTNLRDSVVAICNAVNSMSPPVKAEQFIGQGVGGKSGKKGQTQKEQREILERFRRSDFQVLVATSIGEEGLDIPDVDLIVCFDSSASPTRHIQRMGRTGRFRHGAVVVICAQGKERQDYEANLERTRRLHRQLRRGGQSFSLCSHASPYMLPGDPAPIVTDLSITQKLGIKHAQKDPVEVMENGNMEFDRAASISVLRPVSALERTALRRSGKWKEEHSVPSLLAWPSYQASFSPTANVSHSARSREFVRIMARISTSLRRSDNMGDVSKKIDLDEYQYTEDMAMAEHNDTTKAMAAQNETEEWERFSGTSMQHLHHTSQTLEMVSEEEKSCPTPALQLENNSQSRGADQDCGRAGNLKQFPCSHLMETENLSISRPVGSGKIPSRVGGEVESGGGVPHSDLAMPGDAKYALWEGIRCGHPVKLLQCSSEETPTCEMPPPPPRLSPECKMGQHTNVLEGKQLELQCRSQPTSHSCRKNYEENFLPANKGTDTTLLEESGHFPHILAKSSAQQAPGIGQTMIQSSQSPHRAVLQDAGISTGQAGPSPQALVADTEHCTAPSDRSPMSRLEDSISTPVDYQPPTKSLKRLHKAIDLEKASIPHVEGASTHKKRRRSCNNRSKFIDDTADASSDEDEEDEDLDRDVSGFIDDRNVSQYTASESKGGSSPGVRGPDDRDMLAVYRRTLRNSSPLWSGQEDGRRCSLPAFRSPPRLHPNRGFAKMGCSGMVDQGNVHQYHESAHWTENLKADAVNEPSKDASQHLDYCAACLGDGELILCDGCPAAYHFQCVGLHRLPAGRWFCIQCSREKLGTK